MKIPVSAFADWLDWPMFHRASLFALNLNLNPKLVALENAMKIYDYMAARAKSEGMEHTLLRQQYKQWVNQGVRCFFGVLVDESGTPISDNQNPAFFEEWGFFNRSTSPEQEGMAQ